MTAFGCHAGPESLVLGEVGVTASSSLCSAPQLAEHPCSEESERHKAAAQGWVISCFSSKLNAFEWLIKR